MPGADGIIGIVVPLREIYGIAVPFAYWLMRT
jgi:hypothetical protein